MSIKDIYKEDAKEMTLSFACQQRLGVNFLLEDAKRKEFKFTLKEIDEYLTFMEQWEKRQEVLFQLIECLEVDKKTKKAIIKNQKNNNGQSDTKDTN